MKKVLTEKDFDNTKDNAKRCRMIIEILEGQAIIKQNTNEKEKTYG